MTITQTMKVPDTRRLIIDVPSQIPTGASVIIQFPIREEEASSKTAVPQSSAQQEAANKAFAEKVRKYVEEQKRIVETDDAFKKRGRGCLKGKIWIADDFCDPIEDFKDYM